MSATGGRAFRRPRRTASSTPTIAVPPPGQGTSRARVWGLKLARDLAEGMGGSLLFRSGTGGGTVFVLRLPAGEES